MDPVTAFVRLAEAIVKLVTVIAEGQPIEVKAELWRTYLADLKAIRKALGIPIE